MTDVLVVGAGPAGSATAIHLAGAGLAVHLVDRAQFPRRKACGEGLFPRGVQALENLGVLDKVLPQSKVLDSLQVELSGASVEAPLASPTHPALGVRRELLDAALLDQARKRGIRVTEGVTALDLIASADGYRGVRTSGGDLEARAIVLADGLRSRLRRAAGLEAPARTQRFGVSAHYTLPDEPEGRVRIRMLKNHELYVTPVGGRTVNVALLTSKRGGKISAGHRGRSYEATIEESGVLPKGATLLDPPLTAGPFPAGARRAWTHNLLLVGDTAGFFDGISGEGMSLALVASAFAAGALLEYLENGGDSARLAAYDKARRTLARNSNLLARFSLLLAAHPALGRRLIANLSRRPATFEKVLAVNSGVRGLGDLRPRDLTCLLLGV